MLISKSVEALRETHESSNNKKRRKVRGFNITKWTPEIEAWMLARVKEPSYRRGTMVNLVRLRRALYNRFGIAPSPKALSRRVRTLMALNGVAPQRKSKKKQKRTKNVPVTKKISSLEKLNDKLDKTIDKLLRLRNLREELSI